jgi:Mrp family chromosome partitioning ATPase
MRGVMDECRKQFDFVFIDSPPILGISDALHLGQLVDAAVLVIRENVSNRKAVAETISMMEAAHLPVAGFVFNDVDPRGSGYSYGYTYQDYYRNYYLDDEKTSTEEVSK